MIEAAEPAAGAWLGTLQRIAGRASHEVKNALNGVAVNLEVVRSRTARAGQTTDTVARFAESAAEQFERVSAQAEALLALMRPPREPNDVAQVVRSLHALLGGIMLPGAGGEAVRVEGASSGALVQANGDAVRVLLGEAMLAAIEHGVPVVMDVQEGAGEVVVEVRRAGDEGEIPPLPPAAESIAAGDGIRLERSGHALAMHFPAPRQASQPTGP